MKTTKVTRRLSALLMALVMALAMCVPATALAADETIDAAKTGSITVHKYEGAALSDATNLSQDEMKDLIDQDQNSADPTLTPQADVTFRYLRVGDVKQYVKADGTIKIGYSVPATGTTIVSAAWLGLTAADIDYTDTSVAPSVNYYSPSTLNRALAAALATKTQAGFETLMASAASMFATNAQGESTATGLTVGAYLVSEYTYPAGTAMTTEPFFVSVPTTDAKTDNGVTTTSWIYDVHAYPKNKVEPVNIDKVIVGNDKSETKEFDAEIGQTVTFLVRADVPASVGKLTTYTVDDQLSAGMDYVNGTVKVTGLKADGSRTEIATGFTTDYTARKLALDFDTSAAGKLADATSKMALYKTLEITYDVQLNSNAVVGGAGNPNAVELVYSKFANFAGAGAEPLVTTVPVTLPTIYTYALDYYKYGDSDTSNPLGGVEFELYQSDKATKIAVSQDTTGTENSYYVNRTATATTTPTAAAITTPASGKIYIKGLQAGTYYLKETKTLQGYNLLADLVQITITGNENEYTADAAGTYAPIDTTKTYYTDEAATKVFVLPTGLAAGTYVNFNTPNVYTAANTSVAMFTQDDMAWSANYTMGAKDAADGTSGIVSFKVNNVKGFNLPMTGGSGSLYFLLIGGIVAAVGLTVVFLASRRKKGSARRS